MSSGIAVSNLAYAHPGGDLLFDGVSFRLPPGRHAGLIGANGVGKTTLMRILAGDLQAMEGNVVNGGPVAFMPQDVGAGDGTVRELLLSVAPDRVRRPAWRCCGPNRTWRPATTRRASGSVRPSPRGRTSAAMSSRVSGTLPAGAARAAGSARSATARRTRSREASASASSSICCSRPTRRCCCSTSPTNFLDVPAKRTLEAQIRATRKTVLVISHDRELLTAACDAIVTLEGSGAWVHGGSYAGYSDAREHRQKLMGDRLGRWQEEEKRLRERVRIFKERARYADSWAKRADAAETRWRHSSTPAPRPLRSATGTWWCASEAGTRPGGSSTCASSPSTAWCCPSPRRSISASASA